MKRWSVPFITETTDIYEVDAPNERSATMEATLKRERFKASAGEADKPTHSHVTKFQIGSIRPTVSSPSQVAGGEGNVTTDPSAPDPRKRGGA